MSIIGSRPASISVATAQQALKPFSALSTFNGTLDGLTYYLRAAAFPQSDLTNGRFSTGALDPHQTIEIECWGQGSATNTGTLRIWAFEEVAGLNASGQPVLDYSGKPLGEATVTLASDARALQSVNYTGTLLHGTFSGLVDYSLRSSGVIAYNSWAISFDGAGHIGYVFQLDRVSATNLGVGYRLL